jgi:hypothetical protein
MSHHPRCESRSQTADDYITSPITATPIGKIFPWKNVSKWSLLYRKLQQHSTTSLYNLTPDTLHAGLDSLGPTLTRLELPPKEYGALVAELSEISPEIPETPAAASKNIRYEQDDYSDDGNTLSFTLILVDLD